MTDAEQEEPETEEARGEDRLIVGPEPDRLPEFLHDVDQHLQDLDRSLGPERFETQTSSGSMIDDPEDGCTGASQEGRVGGQPLFRGMGLGFRFLIFWRMAGISWPRDLKILATVLLPTVSPRGWA